MSTSSPLPRPSLTAAACPADEMMAPPAVPSEAELAEAWFDAPPASTRRPSSVPPPPVSAVGEFLGDPLADSWLR